MAALAGCGPPDLDCGYRVRDRAGLLLGRGEAEHTGPAVTADVTADVTATEPQARTLGAMVDQATERMIMRATPARCFEIVSDFERYPEWAADIKAVEVVERDED